MFFRPKTLFLVSLLFVALLNPKFNPYLLFKFYHSSRIGNYRPSLILAIQARVHNISRPLYKYYELLIQVLNH